MSTTSSDDIADGCATLPHDTWTMANRINFPLEHQVIMNVEQQWIVIEKRMLQDDLQK